MSVENEQRIEITCWLSSFDFDPPIPNRPRIICHHAGISWYEPLGQMVQNIRYLHRDGTWHPSCGDNPDWNGYHESKEEAERVLRLSQPGWLWKKYKEIQDVN